MHFTTHTFSMPKNLSLPSDRTGPVASARCFSKGVGCGALGSFFAGADLAAESALFCAQLRCQHVLSYHMPLPLPLPLLPLASATYRARLELAKERHIRAALLLLSYPPPCANARVLGIRPPAHLLSLPVAVAVSCLVRGQSFGVSGNASTLLSSHRS